MAMEKGPKYQKVDFADIQDQVLSERLELFNQSFITVEQELPKSPELLTDFAIAKEMVAKYFSDLGIPTNIRDFDVDDLVACKDGKVNILQKDGSHLSTTISAFSTDDGRIYIHDNVPYRPQRISWLVHELVHKVSFHKERIPRARMSTNMRDGVAISWKKSGYAYQAQMAEEKGGSAPMFRGLNEAVTAHIEYQICERYAPDDIDASEFANYYAHHGPYKREQHVLQEIITGVTYRTGTSRDEFWKSLIQGYVSGEKMLLRSIERVFGPGSLDVLARMDAMEDSSGYRYEDDPYLNYFLSTTTSEARNEIHSVIKRSS